MRLGSWDVVYHQSTFSIKLAYKKLQANFDKVDWRKLLCNEKVIPKSKFILWLALLNKLATADRVSLWSHDSSPLCKIFDANVESVPHLFFRCNYSWQVWSVVLS